MIDKQLLDILACPETREPLHLADDALLAELNGAIAAGRIVNKAGEAVEAPLEAGLLRQDRLVLYPIVDDIPVLLPNAAISLEQLS
jgi:uncharacterized protein YbaR (Trm112 family)